jgi:hypothetical protein
MFFTNSIISYGWGLLKRRVKASVLESSPLLDALYRSRDSFGLEGVNYEFWTYPTARAEGGFWVRNNKTVAVLLSEGFLLSATESQVASMMESLNAGNFQEIRHINRRESLLMVFEGWKGESRNYRFWVISFLLYPLERFFKIAKM